MEICREISILHPHVLGFLLFVKMEQQGLDLSSSMKQLKINRNNSPKPLDFRQWRTVITEKRGTNEVRLRWPQLCLERNFRLCSREGTQWHCYSLGTYASEARRTMKEHIPLRNIPLVRMDRKCSHLEASSRCQEQVLAMRDARRSFLSHQQKLTVALCPSSPLSPCVSFWKKIDKEHQRIHEPRFEQSWWFSIPVSYKVIL